MLPAALLSPSRRSEIATLAAALCAIAALPAIAQVKEAAKQKEADWVDARWNNTDIGNFHSSLLGVRYGTLGKGLSLRVGDKGEGSVAYDTLTATLRAAWTGGFLTFDAARYGLLNKPQPADDLRIAAPVTNGWGAASVRWRGLHVHGPQTLLEYEVNGRKVLEFPGCITNSDLAVFTRSLEIAPGPDLPLTLWAIKGSVAATNVDGVVIGLVDRSKVAFAFAAKNTASSSGIAVENGALVATLPAGACKVFASDSVQDLKAFASFVKANAKSDSLTPLTEPGPLRWKPITTRGQRGFGNDAFIVDTLSVPYDNPFKALFFTSGVDFLPNGDAAVCTIHGDVWLVSGIDDNLQKLTWRRFATGLFQPLGLRVRDGKVYVLGRDQITVLHDLNNDGEAEFYENFFNGMRTSVGGHDYVTSLEKDLSGNFYYVDPLGAHRVSTDGSRKETIAAGWRNPNGMGVSPDGTIITVAPQEGNWTPSSAITEARPGGWYGYVGPRVTPERSVGYDPHLCWIPHSVDNSGGSQLWVTSEKWGALNGHMLHFSYGRCSQFLVLREVVDGMPQGAVTPLPGKFLSGAMRGAFNPKDGQLYVVGSTGWQTSAARDGCLQRVRFTGANPNVALECHTHSNGFLLTFTTALERAAAEDKGSYAVAQWNYRYSEDYGSKDWSITDPKKEGHDTLDVTSARLLPDGKSVFITVPGLAPVMQYEIKYSLNTDKGKAMRSTLWGTINKVGPTFDLETKTAKR